MNSFQYLKGIHPGIVLESELKKRKISKGRFALSIGEYPQILGAITKGKRRMNTSLAIRIENAFGMEEGFFMTLQVFYDIKQERQKEQSSDIPNIKQFRPALFWDTKMEQINWIKQKRAVIERVLGRGTLSEKKELLRFYGKTEVKRIAKSIKETII
ncbi:helix-turn-helix transcriptional regulator [Flavitalea flava]